MPALTPARSIVIGVIVFSAGLIGAGALMPGPQAREIEARRRKLVGLRQVNRPPLPVPPAITVPWSPNPPQRFRRPVTIHAYLKFGQRTPRAELLSTFYALQGTGKTVLHIAFDPNKEEEVRLATALALASKGSSYSDSLRRDVFLVGGKITAGTRLAVGQLMKVAGPTAVTNARAKVLAELSDSNATAHPAGTVLYETDGRYYLAPKPKPPASVASYPSTAGTYFETIDALGDERVPLP